MVHSTDSVNSTNSNENSFFESCHPLDRSLALGLHQPQMHVLGGVNSVASGFIFPAPVLSDDAVEGINSSTNNTESQLRLATPPSLGVNPVITLKQRKVYQKAFNALAKQGAQSDKLSPAVKKAVVSAAALNHLVVFNKLIDAAGQSVIDCLISKDDLPPECSHFPKPFVSALDAALFFGSYPIAKKIATQSGERDHIKGLQSEGLGKIQNSSRDGNWSLDDGRIVSLSRNTKALRISSPSSSKTWSSTTITLPEPLTIKKVIKVGDLLVATNDLGEMHIWSETGGETHNNSFDYQGKVWGHLQDLTGLAKLTDTQFVTSSSGDSGGAKVWQKNDQSGKLECVNILPTKSVWVDKLVRLNDGRLLSMELNINSGKLDVDVLKLSNDQVWEAQNSFQLPGYTRGFAVLDDNRLVTNNLEHLEIWAESSKGEWSHQSRLGLHWGVDRDNEDPDERYSMSITQMEVMDGRILTVDCSRNAKLWTEAEPGVWVATDLSKQGSKPVQLLASGQMVVGSDSLIGDYRRNAVESIVAPLGSQRSQQLAELGQFDDKYKTIVESLASISETPVPETQVMAQNTQVVGQEKVVAQETIAAPVEVAQITEQPQGANFDEIIENGDVNQILERVASVDPDPAVRYAAVRNINDQGSLQRVVSDGLRDGVFEASSRKLAMSKITDQEFLWQCLDGKSGSDEMSTILSLITDEAKLKEILFDPDAQLCGLTIRTIIRGINDLEFLQEHVDSQWKAKKPGEMAYDCTVIAMVCRLQDQEKIMTLLQHTHDLFSMKPLVEALTDQTLLEKIATSKKRTRAVDYAIPKLKNQALLAKIARSPKYEYVQRIALASLKDQKSLEGIALDTKQSAEVRTDAVAKLNDQNVIEKIAKAPVPGKSEIQISAIARLESQQALADIVKNDKDQRVRFVALKKMTDQTQLEALLLNSADRYIRILLIDKISNDQLLSDLLDTETDFEVRAYIQKKQAITPDPSQAPQDALSDSSADTRIAALRRYTFKAEILESVAQKDSSASVRAVATQLVTSQPFLKSLLNDSSEEVRSAAVVRVRESKSLAKAALTDESALVRKNAVEKFGQGELVSSWQWLLEHGPEFDFSALISEVGETQQSNTSEDLPIANTASAKQALDTIGKAFSIESIAFKDGGNVVSSFARSVAAASPIPLVPSTPKVSSSYDGMPTPDIKKASFHSLVPKGIDVEYFGRTLVFSVNGEEFACKLLKESEYSKNPLQTPLATELQKIQLLNDLQSGDVFELKSVLPSVDHELAGLYQLKDVPQSVLNAIAMQGKNGESSGFKLAEPSKEGWTALVYQHPSESHVYLNEAMPVEDFYAASLMAISDAATLAKHGLINESPTSFFHNSADNGRRFLWNIDENQPWDARSGTGRLDAWRKGVSVGNFRKTGLADFKNYLVASQLRSEHSQANWYSGSDDPELTAHRNAIGDTIFGWALTVTDAWLRNIELANQENLEADGDVESIDLRKTLQEGMTEFLSAYADKNTAAASAILEGLNIDFDTMVAQLRYFASKDYVDDVESGRGIPLELYQGPELQGDTQVQWSTTNQSRGWIEGQGWSIDGVNPDLGAVNGANPCQELVKAMYILTTVGFSLQGVVASE